MSKERLEEIKKHRNDADNSTDEYEFEKINFYNLHVDWLIEQAERVQELENHIDHLYDNNVHLKGDYRLQEQNKRYREALEFYADRKTYERRHDPYEPLDTDINDDRGEIARKALEGESNE